MRKKKIEMIIIVMLLLLHVSSSSAKTPNDPDFHLQWNFNNTGWNLGDQTPLLAGADIDAPEAWDIETGHVLIGNPDLSLFWQHPDLIDNIWRNLGEDADGDGEVFVPDKIVWVNHSYTLADGTVKWSNKSYLSYVFDPDDVNGIDDDGNGYVDDFIGWDFEDNDNDPFLPSDGACINCDKFQHGTGTTGVAVAKGNNSLSITGTCWDCKVIATRGLGANHPEVIRYLVDNGVKVITMSWIARYTGNLSDALDYADEHGVVLVTGAGNYGSTTVNDLCQKENIICVSGTNARDEKYSGADASSYGEEVDVAAPAAIFTLTSPDHQTYPKVFSWGTSLSSPGVAGVVGLMLSQDPNLSPEEVKSIIQSSADPILSGAYYIGTGRINAYRALQLTQIAKAQGFYPLALINASENVVYGSAVNIKGTAWAENFDHYEISVANGLYPDGTSYSILFSSNTPVYRGEIYNTADIGLGDGSYTLKLDVYDSAGNKATDTYPLDIIGSICTGLDTTLCTQEPSCDWCGSCQGNKSYTGQVELCGYTGTCSYTCVKGSCGAVCTTGEYTINKECLNEQSYNISIEYCQTNTCTNETFQNIVNCAQGTFCQNGECVVKPYPLGDFNNDYVVNTSDFDILSAQYGNEISQATLNDDNIVNLADLVLFGRIKFTI